MRKITLFASLIMIMGASMAQKAVNDTIMPVLWNDTWTNLVTAGTTKTVGLKPGPGTGGYAFGINSNLDKGVCQVFRANTATSVVGTLIWLGDVSGSGTVNVKVWLMDGTTGMIWSEQLQNNVGQAPCPGTVKASKAVNINTFVKLDSGIDANVGPDRAKMNGQIFSTPASIPANTDYAVGIEHALTLTNGKLGIMSSTDGLVYKATNKCFIKSDAANPGSGVFNWLACGVTWGSHNDYSLCIFPIVQAVAGSVEDVEINGVKLAVYPNPTSNEVKLDYELKESAAKVSFNIVDASGRIVRSSQEVNQGVGSHTVSFNVSDLSAGNYFVTIEADGKRMAKMLNITK